MFFTVQTEEQLGFASKYELSALCRVPIPFVKPRVSRYAPYVFTASTTFTRLTYSDFDCTRRSYVRKVNQTLYASVAERVNRRRFWRTAPEIWLRHAVHWAVRTNSRIEIDYQSKIKKALFYYTAASGSANIEHVTEVVNVVYDLLNMWT